MAQNYTEQLRKDNVRDAIYEDLQNNCEVLRTSWSGNAFPANPKVGQPCYRVDEDKLYYWDGYKWSQKGGGGSAELKTMELAAATSERVSITLEGARCLDKNMMFVFVDKIAQDPSTYSMNDDGTVVNFNPAIPANAAVTLRWFDTDVGTFDTAIFASDAEFAAGELTNKAPNVKQVHSLSEMVASKVSGLELMDVGFAPLGIDESENKRRYLNGQVISQSQFPAFTAAVKARMTTMANAFTTETNWQAEKTNSKLGQCGKFVVDDTAGTIRLPCVVNAQALVDLALIGGIKNESLPNIKGEIPINAGWDANLVTGAFLSSKSNKFGYVFSDSNNDTNTRFDASNYSSTYQDNSPVQQEAVQYPYYIQVATGVEETLPAIREYNINTPFFFGQSMYSDVAHDNVSWLVSSGQWNAKSVYPDYYNWILENINKGVKGFWGQTAYAYGDANGVTYLTTRTPQVGSVCYNMSYQRSGYIEAVYSDGSVKIRDDIGNASYDNIHYYPTGNISSTSLITDYDWVVNTTDETFRLPLKNGQEGIFANGVKGNGMGLGLTNGTKNVGMQMGSSIALLESLYGTQIGSSIVTGNSPSGHYGITTDPSKSGIIVDKTVPSGWNLYYYVGDTVQDASLINAGAVLGQLANKTNSVEAAAASMPSNRYIDLTLGASGNTYTAPANGWVYCVGKTTASPCYISVDIPNTFCGVNGFGANQDLTINQIAVEAGTLFGIRYGNVTLTLLRFVYAQGDQ